MTLYAVILSNAKDLLAGYALSTLSLVGFEEILHYVQNDIHNIITNCYCMTSRASMPYSWAYSSIIALTSVRLRNFTISLW